MGFSRQEHCSGLPFPFPGDLPDPRVTPESLTSPALAGVGFCFVLLFTASATWEVLNQERSWLLPLQSSYKKGSHLLKTQCWDQVAECLLRQGCPREKVHPLNSVLKVWERYENHGKNPSSKAGWQAPQMFRHFCLKFSCKVKPPNCVEDNILWCWIEDWHSHQ